MPRFPGFGRGTGPVPPDYVEDFKRQIGTIADSTQLMAATLPQEIAALTEKLSTTFAAYEGAGASRGASGPRTPLGPGPGASTGSTGGLGGAEAAMRARLAKGEDANEMDTEGLYTGLPVGGSWEQRVRRQGLGEILPLPRYPGAEPNARDLLNYMGTVSANVAYKRQQTLNARTIRGQNDLLQGAAAAGRIRLDDNNNVVDENGNPTSLPIDLQHEMLAAGSTNDTQLGRVSDLFASAENAYAQGRYIKGIISKVTTPFNNLRQLGYQTGFEGGSPGILGLRAPWDPAALAGLSQKTSQWGFALGNNVTPQQAQTIYGNLYGQGWYGGTTTDNMRSASAQMMHQQPYIAQMPQYYEMMDKATRQGMVSLQGFNNAMAQIPEASKAANVSLVQTMSAMDQLGQLNKQQGGTYFAGTVNATAWQNATGLPGAIAAKLYQNPMVQGQTFMQTGLMPWEQGLATPGQHISGVLGALNLLSGSIAPQGNLTQQIGNTGFTNTQTAQQQKEALMAHLLGIDQEVVHNLLTHRKGIAVGAQMTDEANSYNAKVTGLIKQGRWSEVSRVLEGQGKGTWGQVKADLSIARDSQGQKIFTPAQIKYLQDMDKQVGGAGKGHWEKYYNQADASAGTVAHRRWVPGRSGTPIDFAQVAEKRSKYIQAILGGHNKNNTGAAPRLTIELGPAAKKVMHLSDPNAQQKAGNNAGSVSIDQNSWASGATSEPSSVNNLNTAGNYGSSYDPNYNTGGP